MHQHPRPAPRSASSVSTPQTNPTRINNPGDDSTTRTQSVSSESGSGRSHLSDNPRPDDPATAEKQRLNLIVQHFFAKAALIIIASRVNLPGAQTKDGDVRLDKWFNTWIRDTNVLNQDLAEWRTMDASEKLPSTLTIDFYLDLNKHPLNHSLVSVDDEQKRWDVAKSLQNHAKAQGLPTTPSSLVYERWTVTLNDAVTGPSSQVSDAPPNVYKKGVVLLRSLYTYARFLPAWKFSKRLHRQAGNGLVPKPKFCIVKGPVPPAEDTLSWPLSNNDAPVTEEYHFGRLPCTFGTLSISVTYRASCAFELDPAERLLSAQIATGSSSGESSNRPFDSTSVNRPADSTSEELSIRESQRRSGVAMPKNDARGDPPSRAGSDSRAGSGSKSSLRSDLVPGSVPRRTSVSFQPFKAGSLSSSPAGGVPLGSSPGNIAGRPVTTAPPTHSRSRSSLNTLPQQALRNPGIANETAIASSASSSPKPAPIQRYSSSFSNRKARFPSTSGTHKTDEDGSSSRGSVASGQRTSVAFAEPEAQYQDDSESIGDFLKMLDTSSRQLPSFARTDPASLAANSKRTVAQFSKFSQMRDSTAQLSESMSSSLMLQRSSTNSSRQSSNVPGLIGGQAASLSTSSSPGGKPVSPHTPHMPAVPSRLSNNSIASYSRTDTDRSSRTIRAGSSSDQRSQISTTTPTRQDTAGAIDIPESPRVFPSYRRSSSVRNEARTRHQYVATGAIDDEMMPFGLRSASEPVDDTSIPSRSRSGAGIVRGSGATGRGIGQQEEEEEEEEPLLFDLGAF